ncbi:uncharacterized protein LOC143287915 [Babylonia areolata]|uniref:uncharacterized protein LOC143287915 n=1 Tax=Babylonia areolata TaxID=304850 RepID=UPI003FD1EAA5
MTEAAVRRFREAVEKEEDTRKLRDILGMVPKNDVISWTDDNRLDLLHHCILGDNPEAVDFLLKQGYFVRPHEPQLTPYAHLAAFLGHRTTLTVLLQHRPDDFRIAQQPLFIPPGFVHRGGPPKKTSQKSKDSSKNIQSKDSSKSSQRKDFSTSNHRIGSSTFTRTEEKSSASSAASRVGLGVEVGVGVGMGRRGKADRVDRVDGLVTDGSQPLLRTPLDVAARAGRAECVKAMLSVCVLKAHPEAAPNAGHLTLAALEDCPAAVSLLLEQQSAKDQQQRDNDNDTDDFKAALEVSVQRARPECLDLLLAKKPRRLDPKRLFKQINFFHVLYTFSASFGESSYGRLPEATRVLIARGHDVSAKAPPRTYPLYTLLTHALCFHDYSFTRHYVRCLRLLLEAGADPNFDEIRYEKRYRQTKGSSSSSSSSSRFSAAGRRSFSSALHCLLETVETYSAGLASKALAVRFVEECAEVLVSHHADVSKVGVIGDGGRDLQGTVLHQYAKSCVTLGVDRSILRSILRFGAEPDVKVNGKYALNVYVDTLLETLNGSHKTPHTDHRYQDDVSNLLNFMCAYMSSPHIKEAARIVRTSHYGRSKSEQVKYYVDEVVNSLEAHSKRVRPLQSLAAWSVWQACGKRADVVRNLPVKVELKTMILPLM